MTENKKPSIAIIGGTGKEGKGLALRWCLAGYDVIIGSRKEEKAKSAVEAVFELTDQKISLQGKTNEEAVKESDLAVLTVPYSAHQITLQSLKPNLSGKILIDVTVPLVPPKVTRVQMPVSGSALQEAKIILGEDVQVAAAFQNISHENLINMKEIDCDVLVCGENKAVREQVITLVEDAGMVGWDAGPIQNAVVVEGMTSILIGINKKYGVHSSGIRITGVDR